MSVLALDVDRFKAINDTFGQEAGGRVLRRVAEAAQAVLRRDGLTASNSVDSHRSIHVRRFTSVDAHRSIRIGRWTSVDSYPSIHVPIPIDSIRGGGRVSDSPRLIVRPAAPGDVPMLARMLEDYLRETYGAAWHGTPEALLRDGFGGEMEMLVSAAGDGRVTGFAAWTRAYDLHHCVSGGEVIDLYVVPETRGRGVALALLSALADEVRRRGGVFIKGSAVSDAAVRKLYARFAVINPGVDCIVGGRAFRRLAELSGRPAREVLRSLPEPAWNYEA